MVHVAADLAQFVQRRELMAYEQRLARMAYAYGVDLRRSSWLDHSTLGEPLMRGVDRRWNRTVERLGAEALQPPTASPPSAILEELARLLKLLRAPLPTVRLLREDVGPSWPIVTPLGTTMGGAQWLVLDLPRLMAVPAHERTFLLASGLGNLQCDHGPVFAAHLMAHLSGRGLGVVRTLLRPWSRVAVFSADRAGLLAVADLGATLAAMRAHADPAVEWYPPVPPGALRVTALEDFDRSRVMTRLRMMYASPSEWTVAPMRRPGGTAAKAADDGEAEGDDGAQAPEHDHVEGAESREEQIAAAIRAAWSLARCDERLTRRLGLL